MKPRNVTLATLAAAVLIIALVASFVYLDDGDEEGRGIAIIHTNDTHGYYDEYLGFAAVSELRSEYEDAGYTVFVLDAGDAFQGTATTSLSHGETTIDVMNAVGYDLMCPGNHEFDYTLETYLGYADRLDFGTVCANLVWDDTGETVFDAYTVLERDGASIGVFGILSPDTPGSVMAGYMDGVTVTDPAEAAESAVSELEAMDVDLIVALTHLGVDPSSSYTSDMLCSEVDGIDVCIDGHSHTAMSGGTVIDGSIEIIGSDTVIASTGCYIESIGVVTVTSGGIDAYLVDECERDPEVQSVIDGIREDQSGYLSQVIGYAEDDLSGERTAARLGEVIMGDLVTDAMRQVTGAEIALVNGGAIRAAISAGDITVEDAYSTYPFDNYIQTMTVDGATVLSAIEAGLSGLPGAAGAYLQVSGIVVTYDSSREAGDRLVSVKLADGTPLDPDAEYIVAACDYVMSDPSYPFHGMQIDGTSETMVRDALMDLISEAGSIGTDDVVTGRLIDTAAASERWQG